MIADQSLASEFRTLRARFSRLDFLRSVCTPTKLVGIVFSEPLVVLCSSEAGALLAAAEALDRDIFLCLFCFVDIIDNNNCIFIIINYFRPLFALWAMRLLRIEHSASYHSRPVSLSAKRAVAHSLPRVEGAADWA